jgi:dTDP-4-amino-4,6-dideoxygalactose transaminase
VTQQVPLVDLGWQHRQIADEIVEPMRSVMERTAFILGPEVDQFEREFADFSGIAHCVGVANGTDAVELALRAAGIGDGDEVIIPANTFVATASAVRRAGAQVAFADCDDDYLLLDPAGIEAAITERTRAVIAVHLYGQLAPVTALREICDRHGLLLIEDAAQCQGATQYGSAAGTVGLAAATSFYPGKNLGAYGDGGAVLTTEDEIAARLRRLRNHGGVAKYEHAELGTNSRLDTLQAVVLSAKLRRLADWNSLRQLAAERYAELLRDVEAVRLPQAAPGNSHVWHLYVVRVHNRDQVLADLQAGGVGAGIHYPQPVHQLAPFVADAAGRSYPVADAAATQILSLPIFPGITDEQQQQVASVLKSSLTVSVR